MSSVSDRVIVIKGSRDYYFTDLRLCPTMLFIG